MECLVELTWEVVGFWTLVWGKFFDYWFTFVSSDRSVSGSFSGVAASFIISLLLTPPPLLSLQTRGRGHLHTVTPVASGWAASKAWAQLSTTMVFSLTM